MADAWFKQIFATLDLKDIDMDTYRCKVMLLTDTFDLAALDTARESSDPALTDHQVPAGGGYSTGGAIFSLKADWTNNSDGSYSLFAPLPTQWLNSTITARYAAVYNDSPYYSLIYLIDFGGNIVTNNETFEIVRDLAKPVFTINKYPDLVNGLVVNLPFRHYTSPYSGADNDTAWLWLMPDTYEFVQTTGYLSVLTDDGIAVNQDISMTSAVENDEMVFRLPNDEVIFTAVTGTFRYLIVSYYEGRAWALVHDFVSNQTVNGEDVVVSLPNGIHKVVLLP